MLDPLDDLGQVGLGIVDVELRGSVAYPGWALPLRGLSADVPPGGAVDVGRNAALVAVSGRQRP